MQKSYTLAKPGRPNWAAQVKRAAEILRQNPKDSLVNSCQAVPLKYLDSLRAEAEALLLEKKEIL